MLTHCHVIAVPRGKMAAWLIVAGLVLLSWSPSTAAADNPFDNIPDDVVNISSLNLGRERRQEYPAIFMIMLFLVVTITLSLLAVSVVMWDMDPGRDSIVYRMTEQPRLKLE